MWQESLIIELEEIVIGRKGGYYLWNGVRIA